MAKTPVYIKIAASKCWGCDKDAQIISAALQKDTSRSENTAVSITIDEFKETIEGQYIIIYVSSNQAQLAATEPVFDFPRVSELAWTGSYQENIEAIYTKFVQPRIISLRA